MLATKLTFSVHRGLTGRLGGAYLLACSGVAMLACAVAVTQPEARYEQLAWIIACALVAFCGFIALRSNRVIARIESELLRCAQDRRSWQAARPLVGQGELVSAWNDLLGFAEQRQAAPTTNDIDEDAALILRAYRSDPQAIVVTDAQGTILKHNAALPRLITGDPKKSFQNDSLLSVLGLEQQPETCQRLVNGNRSVSLQIQRGEQISNGVWRVCRTRLEGRPDDAPGNLWIIEDVTQAALAAAARDQFLATATHELRTPLANLRAYAEALVAIEGGDFEHQKEFCNIINDECSRLSRLVDQLLAVDQLEAGSLVLAHGEVEVSRVVKEAFDHVRSSAESKSQTVTLNISPKLPFVMGDKDKLQAMLVNLIGNAIKYTQEGGVIEVTAASTSANRLELVVADNGPGISAEDQPHIFDKFYRSRDARVSEQSGNGLGLTFAREIARLHGGDIRVQSRPQEGSRFTVALPAKPAPSTA